jgi:hypothetical protein
MNWFWSIYKGFIKASLNLWSDCSKWDQKCLVDSLLFRNSQARGQCSAEEHHQRECKHILKVLHGQSRSRHWPCSIYGDMATAEVRAFTLLELHRAAQSCFEGSEFVFIQDLPPSPAVNQSCQCGAIRSPPHCYRIWAVRSSIWPHPPNGISDHIFRSSINCLLQRGELV